MAKTNPGFRSNKAKMVELTVALVAGLLVAAPAFAQSTPQTTSPSQPTMQQSGGGSSSNTGATDASASEPQKQHIDGGDSPANPRATDAAAAEWRKQHPYAQ